VHTTVPSYWLRWGLANFLPGWPQTMILPILASQVAEPLAPDFSDYFIVLILGIGQVATHVSSDSPLRWDYH
jgi:hypothetical protein